MRRAAQNAGAAQLPSPGAFCRAFAGRAAALPLTAAHAAARTTLTADNWRFCAHRHRAWRAGGEQHLVSETPRRDGMAYASSSLPPAVRIMVLLCSPAWHGLYALTRLRGYVLIYPRACSAF